MWQKIISVDKVVIIWSLVLVKLEIGVMDKMKISVDKMIVSLNIDKMVVLIRGRSICGLRSPRRNDLWRVCIRYSHHL